MRNNINIAIIEDMDSYRQELQTAINHSEGLNCVETFVSAEDALQGIKSIQPDIILVDIGLPGMSGIEFIRKIKHESPGVLFLIITIMEDSDNVFQALAAGASGYILKAEPLSEIIAAILELQEGGSPMSSLIARKVVRYFHKHSETSYDKLLTKREKEVLELLATGKQYKEIADLLFVALDTIKKHCYNIYDKLHVSNRTEAVIKIKGGKFLLPLLVITWQAFISVLTL